jgi:alpha-tubulin suppressor-like RCC1 family protein
LNTSGQTNVPPGLSNVVAVAAGATHSAALRADGTVAVWGGSVRENQTNIPPGLIQVAAIDAGGSETIALREDGTIAEWGGSTTLPVPSGLRGVVGFSAALSTSANNLALLTNGALVAWNTAGAATNTPPGLTNLIAVESADGSPDQGVSAILGINLALRSNGTVTAWGGSIGALTNVPPGLSNVVALAGGATHVVALVNDGQPLIVRPPVGGTFYSGAGLALKAKALGNAPLAFQWFKDGNPISGANSDTLFLASAQSGDAGSYQLVVNNALGVAQSLPAPVTIIDGAPLLFSQPASRFAYYGSSLSIGAAVAGSGPMQLTWLQNGSMIAGGTNQLSFDRAMPQHGGSYQLIASNAFGAVTSSVAQVTFSRVATWGTGPSLTNPPVDLGSVQAVASGYLHALAIQSNGTVGAWGTIGNGATNVPAGLSNVIAVSGGNSFSVALRSDGTVAAWGLGSSGQTNVPPGLGNVRAVSAGGGHALALRADGTVVAWGSNSSAQTNVPAGLSNVVAIAAGSVHSLALKSDGTLVGWGAAGKIPSYTNVVAISAGYGQSLALQANGTVIAWSAAGAATGLPPGISNVVAISAGGGTQGWFHSVALRSDGTLVAWGNNSAGQLNIPSDLLSTTSISAGGSSTLAYLGDLSPAITAQPWSRSVNPGTNLTLAALGVGQPGLRCQWFHNGDPVAGATNNWLTLSNTQPAQSGGYQFVASNNYGSATSAVAMVSVPVPAVKLAPLGVPASGFQFSFTSLAGVLYVVEFKDNLTAAAWSELERRFGVGGLEIVTDPTAGGAMRFYRVRALYVAAPKVSVLSFGGGAASFSFASVAGAVYAVQYKNRLDDPEWIELSRQPGTGGAILITDPAPPASSRFYRIRVE